MLLLIPVSLLGGGTSTAGRLVVVVTVAALVPIAALLVAVGILPFRRSYLWAVLFAGLLILSFAFPRVRAPLAVRPGPHRIASFAGALGGLAPDQLGRLSDLVGILAGLGLMILTIASSPHPRQVARVIALSGMAAAGYVLVRGGFDNTRLEGLGCNPNYLGFALLLPLVATVGLTRYTRNPRWLLPAGLCALALSATHSRGAFLAAAVGVAVVLVQGRSRLFQGLLASVAVTLIGAAGATGMLRSVVGHIENLGAGDRSAADLSLSNGLRLRAAKFAARVAAEHPLRGIGFSMFPTYAERSPGFGVYLATHDEYLRLAAEAGIPTLVVFLVLLWLGLERRLTGDPRILRAIVLAHAVILFFANPLANLVVSAPFWVALGCLSASRPHPAPGEAVTPAADARTAAWRRLPIASLFRSRSSREEAKAHVRQPSRSP